MTTDHFYLQGPDGDEANETFQMVKGAAAWRAYRAKRTRRHIGAYTIHCTRDKCTACVPKEKMTLELSQELSEDGAFIITREAFKSYADDVTDCQILTEHCERLGARCHYCWQARFEGVAR